MSRRSERKGGKFGIGEGQEEIIAKAVSASANNRDLLL